MKVLVACEFSGVVRDAFRKRGHDAWSCDLIDSESERDHHIIGDVTRYLSKPGYANVCTRCARPCMGDECIMCGSATVDCEWDLMIAHPPCTYLCSMGIWWNRKRPDRWQMTNQALDFVKLLWSAPIPRIAIENPVGYLNTHWRKPDQIIHPWMFGDEANKPTCLWLKRVPPLMHHEDDDLLFSRTHVGRGAFYVKANGSRASIWSHRCSGTDKAKRAKIASRTFDGIAKAMVDQWG